MTHEATTAISTLALGFALLAWLRSLAAQREVGRLRRLLKRQRLGLKRVGRAVDRMGVERESFEYCVDESIEDLCQRIYELQEAKRTAIILNWRNG